MKKDLYIVDVDMLVEMMKNIHNYCDNKAYCYYCPFFIKSDEQREYMEEIGVGHGIDSCCQLCLLGNELKYHPSAWDMENIEWLLKQ